MLREVLAFLAIPLLVKINKFLALAPSGAATMDSGLPVVIKYTNINVGLFVIIRLASVILMLFNLGGFPFLQYLQVPSSPELLLYRPWTLLLICSRISTFCIFCLICCGYTGSAVCSLLFSVSGN